MTVMFTDAAVLFDSQPAHNLTIHQLYTQATDDEYSSILCLHSKCDSFGNADVSASYVTHLHKTSAF